MSKHNLENEVDNIGKPGYGTTNFGVSAYESSTKLKAKNAMLATGIASAGLLAWKFGETLLNYGLLMRESTRSK